MLWIVILGSPVGSGEAPENPVVYASTCNLCMAPLEGRPPMFPGVRSRGAFTLIELLVVIAIIAILAAILFPVFAQARDKARAASCLSNNKQLTLGFLMYTQDYDETNPLAFGYSMLDGVGYHWQYNHAVP